MTYTRPRLYQPRIDYGVDSCGPLFVDFFPVVTEDIWTVFGTPILQVTYRKNGGEMKRRGGVGGGGRGTKG